PERVAEELAVGQAQHARPERRQRLMRQRRLAVREAAQARAEQHVRAALDQGHETGLREGALPAAGLGTPESGTVLRRVGYIQARAVQADHDRQRRSSAPAGTGAATAAPEGR